MGGWYSKPPVEDVEQGGAPPKELPIGDGLRLRRGTRRFGPPSPSPKPTGPPPFSPPTRSDARFSNRADRPPFLLAGGNDAVFPSPITRAAGPARPPQLVPSRGGTGRGGAPSRSRPQLEGASAFAINATTAPLVASANTTGPPQQRVPSRGGTGRGGAPHLEGSAAFALNSTATPQVSSANTIGLLLQPVPPRSGTRRGGAPSTSPHKEGSAVFALNATTKPTDPLLLQVPPHGGTKGGGAPSTSIPHNGTTTSHVPLSEGALVHTSSSAWMSPTMQITRLKPIASTGHASFNCTAATISFPTAPPPTPPLVSKILDNYICSVIGNGVSMLLSLSPAMYYVWISDYTETMKIWNVRSIEIGTVNCMVWLLYGASVSKRDGLLDMMIAGSFCLGVSITLLLMKYANDKEKIKAFVWTVGAMVATCGALTILQLELHQTAYSALEVFFGAAGNLVILCSHGMQLYDLYNATEDIELHTFMFTVIPNTVFTLVQCVVTFAWHINQLAMLISSCINILGYVIEIAMMARMHKLLKKKGKQMLQKINTFRGYGDRSDQNDDDDDDTAGYESAMEDLPAEDNEIQEGPAVEEDLPNDNEIQEVPAVEERQREPPAEVGGEHGHEMPRSDIKEQDSRTPRKRSKSPTRATDEPARRTRRKTAPRLAKWWPAMCRESTVDEVQVPQVK